MQRSTWVIAVAVIAAIALMGLIATLVTRQGPSEETARSPAEAPSAGAERATEAADFAFRRLEIDTARAVGEACLVFTAPLDESGKTRYGDYVQLEPDTPFDVRPQGSRLCLAGLGFGADYTATLRAGLPDAKGRSLRAAETVPVSLRDRPPFVGFGDGFILPRSSGEGLPVTTVNVEALELQVIRVNDRLISQLRSDLVNERIVYGYDREQFVHDQGREIWHGTMTVKGPPNEAAVTLFPLREAIKSKEPGVYLVTARDAAKKDEVQAYGGDDDDWQGRAAQWVVDTDIGLSTYAGADGLTVFARSLASAEPIDGLELVLVARDNGELGRIKTAGDGAAQFAAGLMRGTGGAEPILVMAYGRNGDFAYSDLRRPAFDLSDRGVSGRDAPGAVDAYLFTERGIYRAGETVQLVTMLRDREARALEDMPVSLLVRRPDGLEYRRLPLGKLSAGGGHTAIPLTDTAPRGRWSVTAYLGKDEKALGRATFDVQDFVPERLKVTLDPPKTPLRPGDEITFDFNARFLYGAPAANLGGSAEMRLMRAEDPFPDYPGHRFGLAEESFAPTRQELSLSETDAEGKGVVTGRIDAAVTSSAPLEATVTVAVEEPGGRATREQAKISVLPGDLYLGLRPQFENDQVAENSDAHFELIALDRAGQRVARRNLRYELIREETEYQWYQVEGEWRYDAVTREKLMQTGTLSVGAEEPHKLSARVQWGAYRFSVRDPGGAATSLRFHAGWGAAGSESRPDRINVTSQAERYIVGQKANIALRPPIAGKALVVLAADKILAAKLVDVPKAGTEVTFDVTNEWGSGVYAIVTLYRPLEARGTAGKAPARAIGLAWLPVDMKDRTLAIDIQAPEIVRPRMRIQVPVQVTNARPGETLALTLAAVDEGILQLTDYESPAPGSYYFGKKKLGLDIRDDYGRLIEPSDAAKGPIRSGGDSLGGRGLTAVPTRTVALFSGLLQADSKGRAIVPLEIPDFVGELRLMATAFGPARLGEASEPLIVRDPVIADLSLPRFLAPGDEASATLLIDNVEGAAGSYKAEVRASGPVRRADTKPITVTLEQKAQSIIGVPLKADGIGIATITATLEGPESFKVTRAWPIEVRPAALPDFKRTVSILNPNSETKLEPVLLAGLLPDTANLSVAVADNKGLDVPGLLRWLDRYPYGCIEQTTSRAMPLLYANKLAAAAGLAQDRPVEMRVQEAIERVVDMQRIDGSFGMWSAGGEAADAWIGVFATDFLNEAKARKHVVPDAALLRSLAWLRQVAGNESLPDGVRAYALYVLAKGAAVPVGDVRYFFDTQHDKFKSAVAPAFVAGALAELGDRARAADGFARARHMALTAEPAKYEPLPYGSLLRDIAAVTAVTVQAGDAVSLTQLMGRIASLEPPIELTTTQEKAWLVRAADALEQRAQGVAVDVKGVGTISTKSSVAFAPSRAELIKGVFLANTGNEPVWWTATATGTPERPAAASASGISIEKRYYTLDGAAVDLAHVKQSTRLIVSIRGQGAENIFRNGAVLDLLPAGFEIEAVIAPLADGSSPYPFLPPLTDVSAAEARDDRFIAAFTFGDRYRDPKRIGVKPTYHVAYVVRAVTPGRFVLPGAKVEDMYHPEVRANTAGGTLVVEAE